MSNYELTTEEVTLLREALERYLSNLRMEISDTDLKEYRDGLKHKKTVLAGIVDKLATPS